MSQNPPYFSIFVSYVGMVFKSPFNNTLSSNDSMDGAALKWAAEGAEEEDLSLPSTSATKHEASSLSVLCLL